ncbi:MULTISPECIES: FxsA family protein [Corynebacterium]|uniref:FxsA family protein n=1 Tax=Corynebacterium TaxID=1716 RepID=UPI00188330C5|nr:MULTISPECIES: FxsA family protein [Corynebacterium]MBF0582044.1 FxsA family protein [Corynebacterium sp. ED61]
MPLFAAAYLIVEVIAFILLGMWIGFGWALLAIIGLFVAGLAIASWQFRALTQRATQQAEHPEGGHPGRLTGDLALTFVGSLLVAVPGVVSSLAGIFFLLPPTRALIRKGIGAGARAALARFADSTFTSVYGVARPGSKADRREQRSSQPQGWGEVIDHREGESHRPESPEDPHNNGGTHQ